MNKSLNVYLLFSMLLLSFSLTAQIHYTAIPGNSAQVTAEIFDDFDQLIDISPSQLEDHITTLVDPNAYCPTCPGTGLSAQQSNPNIIQLNWPAVNNASSYTLQSINLANGTTGYHQVNSNSTVISNLPNGPYAFSIVANSVGNNQTLASLADIVILETPILIDEIAYNCDCAIEMAQSLTITASTITWFPEINRRYKFILSFLDGTNAEIILLSTISYDPDYPMDFDLQCVEFLYHSDESNTFFSEDPASDFTVHLDYDEQFYFEFDGGIDNPLISAALIQCQIPLPPLKRNTEKVLLEEIPFSIYPNPANDGIWLNYSGDLANPVIATIFNDLGQRVKQTSLQAPRQFININELPAGRYLLELKSTEQTEKMFFIKLN